MKIVGNENNPAVEQLKTTGNDDINVEKPNIFNTPSENSTIDTTKEETQAIIEESKLPGVNADVITGKAEINQFNFKTADMVITASEKANFIDSLITGERYRQTCSLFGDKVRVVIRNRTADETHAMYAYIRHTLSNKNMNVGVLEGDMSYIMLIAQIDEINGIKYPEMKIPLQYTESEGKVNEPGWYEDLKTWKSKPEGLTSALIKQIQLFEFKYWTMVNEAGNKNFWNSDTSTVE